MSKPESYRTGVMGELRAAWFLRKKGCKILALRYRVSGGEIDIIARRGEEIIFAEVKTRSKAPLGSGAAAVGHEKQTRIKRAAKVYLNRHRLQTALVRFDVIEITPAGLRHIEHAF